MEDLQIRWRWLDQNHAVPVLQALNLRERSRYFNHRDQRQIDRVINRFVVIESDLGAFASGVLPGRRLFRLAVTVWGAAALGSTEHEILLAGDAPAPDKRREEEQRKKRTGESSAHHSA